MSFEVAARSAETQTSAPAPTPAAARTNSGAGYDAQAAKLKPASKAPTGKAADKSADFDPWKLTPEVKALFVELGQTKDEKRVETIMNTLTAAPHSVPKATVQQVIVANEGFFSKTYGAIKGGSWHTASTDDKGNITSIFKVDGKGLGWDNETWSLDANFKDPAVTYTDKDDNWHVTGGFKDKQGTLSGAAGTKKEGLHTWSAKAGEKGGSAAYTNQKGETTKHGGVTVGVGDKTSVDGVYRETEGKNSTEYKAGYAGEGDQHSVTGAYAKKTAEGATQGAATVLVGPKTGASGSYKVTEGKDSKEYKGGYVHTEGQHTADGGYTTATKDGSTATSGQVQVGKTNGAKGAVKVVEGEETTEYKAGHSETEGQHTTALGYSRKDKESSETATLNVYNGDKTGAAGAVVVDREGHKIDVKADGSQTVKDDDTTTTAGGAVVYTDKPSKDAKGKPKEGEGFTVRASGRVTKKDNKASGDSSTKVDLGAGATLGQTTTNLGYKGLSGTAGGTGFNVHEFKADWSKDWDLDAAAKEGLTLKIGGGLRLTDKEGEEDTYKGELMGRWTKGKGDTSEELTFRLEGGYDTIGNIGKLGHVSNDMLNGEQGYGHYAHGAAQYRDGKKKYGLDLTYGQTANTQMAGGHFGYENGKENKLDMWASMAKTDAATASMFRLTSQFALSKSLSLTSGGEYSVKPGDEGYETLWHAHTGLGIDLSKGSKLTLKMGLAGDGENMYYVPEAMYQLEKKFSVSAMAHIAQDGPTTFGAKLNIDKADLTIFGGYGDMGALTKPYAGNAGMTMPGMGGNDVMGQDLGGGGGFIGVQWNALPTLKKLFGGK